MLDKLPVVHPDPFDRLPVCRAIHDGMALLTPGAATRRRPGPLAPWWTPSP